ncbi:MAG: helix-turn-helix domain-containing protein [Acidimicrobiia bacterium]|nr:helix-turn-helix domain-containing protein [Acidimicrobiia bacterium]
MEVIALFAKHDLTEALERILGDSEENDIAPPIRPKARAPRRRLTGNEVDQLVAAYEAGASMTEVAALYHIHHTTVLLHLRRRGVPTRANVRKLTDQDAHRAARYYQSGESLATVGKRFGVDAQTIRREFAKAGLETRPRPGWPRSKT